MEITGGQDKRIWTLFKDSRFSVATFFKALAGWNNSRFALGRIWKLKAPPRSLVFGWLALKNRISTMDNLRRKGLVLVNACPLCLQDEESVEHLLLKCSFTHRVWTTVLDSFGCRWVLPNSLLALFEAWINPPVAPRGKEMWNWSFVAVIWTVWKERNSRCFEGIASSANSVSDKTNLSVAFWVSTNPLFHGLSLEQIMLNCKDVAVSF